MKGIMYDFQLYKVILKKLKLSGKYSMIKYRDDWSIPEIKYPNQVQIKTHLGGICASDLHMLNVDLSYVSSILASNENLFPLGHEVVGEIVETGSETESLEIDDRVVFTPVASCDAYGFSPCSSCKKGNLESCYSLVGVGDGTKLEQRYGGQGFFGGFGGGGYSEYFVGFEKQFYKVPPTVSDEAAVFAEPFSIGLHAVVRNFPKNNETVIVFGAGVIGSMVIASIRTLGSRCKIICLARYPHQAEIAKRIGANEVILEQKSSTLYQRIADATDGMLFKPTIGKQILYGNSGPDIIFDSVATETTLDNALHLVKSNGKIVILGFGYSKTKKIDWALQIYKELEITGSIFHGKENWENQSIDTFRLALRLMKNNPNLFKDLITHRFPIEDYKSAFNCSLKKNKHRAIKVAFEFK